MEAFGISNTMVPVILLLALAICVPVLTVPPRVKTQTALAQGMIAALGLVLIAAALMFAELYRREGNDILTAVMDDPVGRVGFFLSRALLSMMFWGPILAFIWFGRAQEVERRKGEDKAREGRSQ